MDLLYVRGLFMYRKIPFLSYGLKVAAFSRPPKPALFAKNVGKLFFQNSVWYEKDHRLKDI
jgi:hypothetical protein